MKKEYAYSSYIKSLECKLETITERALKLEDRMRCAYRDPAIDEVWSHHKDLKDYQEILSRYITLRKYDEDLELQSQSQQPQLILRRP